jgi:hypothetical protein
MTLPLCHKPCSCVCRQNHITWLESEIRRIQQEVANKQRIIERMMDTIPTTVSSGGRE